jgi:hypothetical protein
MEKGGEASASATAHNNQIVNGRGEREMEEDELERGERDGGGERNAAVARITKRKEDLHQKGSQ